MRCLWGLVAAALVMTGCGGPHPAPVHPGPLSGQAIEVLAVWSDEEQAAFERVLDVFERRTGASVTYVSGGDEVPTVLATRLAGGSPPDVAGIAQPALVRTLARAGSLVPLDPGTESVIDAQFAPVWKELGTVDGRLYGFVFKAANKSTIWYDAGQLGPGFVPPRTWDGFVETLRKLSDTGDTPLSVGGADGWTLTDWFENVYLQTAGGAMYDRLARHEIPWTDPSVRTALQTLGRVFRPEYLPGGISSALQTEFTESVVDVFGEDPQAAIVFEADFVAGVIAESTSATVGVDARVFPFPRIGPVSSVVSGGDTLVALTDEPGTRALMQFLAGSEAASIWAAQGGFVSPNREVELGQYPDDSTRQIAEELVGAENLRFDMSDLMPSAFGATRGDGFWRAMQDHLADPAQIDRVLAELEAEATAAYERGDS
ncbi:carbohydrate ABC transporter substrate-binding protein (CUT1 family) [Pseudonocardia hierapolitana]|uniref:Carbohydrate ABC transporter substrate-binding protein (CUT1 family) n=1 Tax=Pseudonocardia hierapolitana TaxID=1128676 RepID=A0A561SX28_9PSEU|nr:ABC transporter substrate-binding protein [Pseudonocardia hierapolitana]TWF79407.1 carbohydrate ABC transporter substrate-binding protein (CUT1 family) [Pseudonocardia hierapolitana]